MKICSIDGCNNECDKGRRYCHRHYLERVSKQRAEKKALGLKTRTMYKCFCSNCKKKFDGFRKDSMFCSKQCFYSFRKSSNGVNPYEYDKKNYHNNIWKHRNIAENILGRKLNTNEVVHHLDLNPKNNEITNLIVLSRSKHTKLHTYLDKQRAILERSSNENIENCWKILIVPMTTTWLETTNVKVQKLWEIGQSAAEPL